MEVVGCGLAIVPTATHPRHVASTRSKDVVLESSTDVA